MTSSPLISRKIILPFILITSLFALWGFANAVTDPMVSAFKKVLEIGNIEASLVQMAFYGGYFTMAFPAALFIRKYSYKKGIYVGLSLYALGALLFYPAAVYEAYYFFLAGLYILTFGLAFLETTANPYILAMGDKQTATQRLNLAQVFNPIGSIAGLLVAQQFVLKKLQSDDVEYATLSESAKAAIRTADLAVIRNPYVAIGVGVLVILVLIAITKMPERKDKGEVKSIGAVVRQLWNNKLYRAGVVAQAFYVGAQIMCWTYIYHYAESIGIDGDTAGNYQFIAFVLFFSGRLICTFLLRYISSGKLLMILSVLAILCTLSVIFSGGITGLYSLVAISFCMSLMFPTIYGIALEDLNEEQSKIGAAFLVMAIVGGALMPTVQGVILDFGGSGFTDITIIGVPEVNFSFILPLICFLVVALYGRMELKQKAM